MPIRKYSDPAINGDYRAGPSGYGMTSHAANGYTPRGENGRHHYGGDSGVHTYNVDHLVTWSIGSEHGVLTHEDGMRQLSKMEKQTGIFTMRCILTVDNTSVQIVDGQTGNAMELFPLNSIRDPVAVTDKNGMFNNIALFTVVDDPKSKHSPSDMHIFQVAGHSARELADDIAEAIASQHAKPSRSSRNQQPATSATSAAATRYESEELHRANRSTDAIRVNRRTLENEGDKEEDIKMGVALLNRCFDDVERFVLRLKHSAKAFQELTSRKKHSKGRKYGAGMLTMRSRTPAPAEFVECFQKVKLSFNLLARLKAYLHNPNSTELVHFLFTPLSLLVEASHDPRFDIHDLVQKVVTPLLTKEAVEMLENCLTSKEFEFWCTLGDPWRTPRHKYTHTQSQEFRPKFSDGYQPPEAWLEMFLGDIAKLAARQAIDRHKSDEEPGPHYNGLPNASTEHDAAGRRHSAASPAQRPTDIPLYSPTPRTTDRSGDGPSRTTPWDDYQRAYLRDLQQRNAKIYEVIQDRKGNNTKELTIRKGEIVEVLEDNRNWWKCANINGDQGFVPYTLLNKYENVRSPRKL